MSRNVENELPSPFSMERPFRKRVTEQQYPGPEQRHTRTKRAGEHSTHVYTYRYRQTYIHILKREPSGGGAREHVCSCDVGLCGPVLTVVLLRKKNHSIVQGNGFETNTSKL